MNSLDLNSIIKKIVKNHFFYITLIWALIYIWRPFVLGAYHDDWACNLNLTNQSSPFSLELLNYILFKLKIALRPVLAFILFLFTSVLGKNILLLHFSSIIINLSVSLLLKSFWDKLLKLLEFSNNKIISSLIAVLWLCIPFILGLTIPLIMYMTLFSLIFFLIGGIELIKGWENQSQNYLKSSLFFLLSFLTYEAFYFQFTSLFLIGIILYLRKKTSIKIIAKSFIWVSSAQILAISYNKIFSYFFYKTKTFNDNWYNLYLESFKTIPGSIRESLSNDLSFVATTAISGLIILAIYCIYKIIKYKKKEAINILLILALLIIGYISINISSVLYAIVGYGFTGVGYFSRTLFAIAFWLIFIIGIISSLFKYLEKNERILSYIILGILVGTLGISNIQKTRHWAKSWKIQQQIISSAPINKIKSLQDKSIVLLIAPCEYKRVVVFQAPWDITQAMQFYYNELKEKDIKFYPKAHWSAEYSKDKLSIKSGQNTVYKDNTNNLWIWDYYKNSFYKVNNSINIEASNKCYGG